MIGTSTSPSIAFLGTAELGRGELRDIILAIKSAVESNTEAQVWVFEQETSEPVEFDLRGSDSQVLARLDKATEWAASHSVQSTPARDEPVERTDGHPRGPGRPKLGVIAREITLLPRHWDWLGHQPGGASVAVRKLVEAARKSTDPQNQIRLAQERAYRFMLTMAGDLSDFEEAMRAFFGGDQTRFEALSASWPPDVRKHAHALALRSFQIGNEA